MVKMPSYQKNSLEKIAELEHQRWSHWMQYQFKVLNGDELHDVKLWTKWKEQTEKGYHQLSEKEKESDREWARKVLAVFDEGRGKVAQQIREIFDEEEYEQLSREDYQRLKNRVLGLLVESEISGESEKKP